MYIIQYTCRKLYKFIIVVPEVLSEGGGSSDHLGTLLSIRFHMSSSPLSLKLLQRWHKD